MFGYVSEELYVELQQYWETTLQDKVNRDDYKVGEKLVSTSALVPLIFSPPYLKDKAKKKHIKSKVRHTKYLVLAIKENNTDVFKKYDDWVSGLNYHDWLKIKPSISSGKIDATVIRKDMEHQTINYWMIEFKYYLCNESYSTHCLIEPVWAKKWWDEMINAITSKS